MDKDKQRQEVSLVGRILSMEGMIFLMGCLSLIYGIAEGKSMNIFWGVMILGGFFVLLAVRKKDWKKHWEEMEAEQKARDAYNKRKSSGDTTPPTEG